MLKSHVISITLLFPQPRGLRESIKVFHEGTGTEPGLAGSLGKKEPRYPGKILLFFQGIDQTPNRDLPFSHDHGIHGTVFEIEGIHACMMASHEDKQVGTDFSDPPGEAENSRRINRVMTSDAARIRGGLTQPDL